MELNIIGNKIHIKGNVKSVSHYEEIKRAIDSLISTNRNIIIELEDSIALTSSVIGELSTVINEHDVTIEVYVGDDVLYETLNDIGVEFKVKKL